MNWCVDKTPLDSIDRSPILEYCYHNSSVQLRAVVCQNTSNSFTRLKSLIPNGTYLEGTNCSTSSGMVLTGKFGTVYPNLVINYIIIYQTDVVFPLTKWPSRKSQSRNCPDRSSRMFGLHESTERFACWNTWTTKMYVIWG